MTDSNAVRILASLSSPGAFTDLSTVPRQVLDEFYRSCAAAGPSRCALATKNTTAPSKESALVLKAKVDGLLDSLWETPLQVRTSDHGPGLLKASQVHALVSPQRIFLQSIPQTDDLPCLSRS